jgi:hypothetical protein
VEPASGDRNFWQDENVMAVARMIIVVIFFMLFMFCGCHCGRFDKLNDRRLVAELVEA